MVTANMSGSEKLKLLVIGKRQRPHCFQVVKSLETDLDFNQKAKITTEIYTTFLMKFNHEMIKQKGKILLFVDNCPAHPLSLIHI